MTATIEKQFFSPPEVAELLSVGHDKILHWISSGQLAAVDVSTNRIQRPRWRIAKSALDDFLTRRSSAPPPKKTRRRPRQSAGVHEYY